VVASTDDVAVPSTAIFDKVAFVDPIIRDCDLYLAIHRAILVRFDRGVVVLALAPEDGAS